MSAEAKTMFADGLFEDQVCIVTGGGSGIGLASAGMIGAPGGRVAICGRTEEKLENAKKELVAGGMAEQHILAAPCDIREPDQIAEFVDAVLERFGRIDVLINNAALCPLAPLDSMSDDDLDACLALNIRAVVRLCRAVWHRLR